MEQAHRRARWTSGAARGLWLTLLLAAALAAGQALWPLARDPQPATGAEGWPNLALDELIDGLSRPVDITNAGDGSGRLFVVEQAGRIRIVKAGALLSASFLDMSSRVQCCGETGLLGLAFPPGYAQKGYFYVNYTERTGDPQRPRTVIARYFVTANPDRADNSREQRILTIDQPYSNHNGGQLAFGKDGYLYIGLGDGGSANDPQNRAQNPNTLLGKLLRIDVEPRAIPASFDSRGYLPQVNGSSTAAAPTYRIPPDNPFVGRSGYRGEIWALGLRNPWRFSFDRANGDLYIADVGQGAYEEIDYQPTSSQGGQNYGWRIREGAHCNGAISSSCSAAGLTDPVHEYDHSQGESITGGFVYRGQQQPALSGIYIYADYVSGRIWGLRREGASWANQQLLDAGFNITTFGESEAGELYLSDYNGGVIYQLISP